jgi:two-component system, chemotaxis family, protein-glutamate methylesterase/glutaminase
VSAGARELYVLVVDDSAVMRQVLTALLSSAPGVSVGVAADPIFAVERMRTRRPDVIVLDLELPRMDGMTFLRRIMAEDPIPVVICSSHIGEGGRQAVDALSEGAVDVITKPQVGLRGFLEESAQTLIDTVLAAAQSRPFRRAWRKDAPKSEPIRVASRSQRPLSATEYIVALGASTGGTEALRGVLEALPKSAPPVLIVQHMPEHFTGTFAKSLDRTCRVEVKEAVNGDRLARGRVLVARGNHHLELRQSPGGLEVMVSTGPLVNRHRPSVDVLFRSVAKAAGKRALGVIMTGMGGDGADGLLEMRRAGARTIAQDEASSIVFGMPKVAIQRGAAKEVLPLESIAGAILEGP